MWHLMFPSLISRVFLLEFGARGTLLVHVFASSSCAHTFLPDADSPMPTILRLARAELRLVALHVQRGIRARLCVGSVHRVPDREIQAGDWQPFVHCVRGWSFDCINCKLLEGAVQLSSWILWRERPGALLIARANHASHCDVSASRHDDDHDDHDDASVLSGSLADKSKALSTFTSVNDQLFDSG